MCTSYFKIAKSNLDLKYFAKHAHKKCENMNILIL